MNLIVIGADRTIAEMYIPDVARLLNIMLQRLKEFHYQGSDISDHDIERLRALFGTKIVQINTAYDKGKCEDIFGDVQDLDTLVADGMNYLMAMSRKKRQEESKARVREPESR